MHRYFWHTLLGVCKKQIFQHFLNLACCWTLTGPREYEHTLINQWFPTWSPQSANGIIMNHRECTQLSVLRL